MKKRTKLLLGGIVATAGVLALASCTKSFCSPIDQGRMLYAFDPGVTRYAEGGNETISVTDEFGNTYKVENISITYATYNTENKEFQFPDNTKLTYLSLIAASARDSGYSSLNEGYLGYLTRMDQLVLEDALKQALFNEKTSITADYAQFDRDLSYYSYLKYVNNDGSGLWDRWDNYDAKIRGELGDDYCPGTDFIGVYKSRMNTYVSNYRTCLTTKTDKYGSYGYVTNGEAVFIDAKSWSYAWQKGFFEGLLVYPIGWLIDQINFGFRGLGVDYGGAALLAIFFITLIIRSLMMLATIRQTAGNAKMTELQPEIAKIQAKYPNANTSQSEKQRMAQEMNQLYKKNKINPFTTLIVLIIQFPVFICVWGALSGSAALSSGTVLGLDLSLTIREVLFTQSNWWPNAAGFRPAVTALFLFLLMALAQAASMLLPQWIQKRKNKNIAKLGKNPAQNQQANRMKWFTYIMLAMIIFMGFTIVSAMGVYWFVGAIFSVVQTLIMQAIAARRKKKS